MPTVPPVLLDLSLIVALMLALREMYVCARRRAGLERRLAEARHEGQRCGGHVRTLSELNHALQSSDTLGEAIDQTVPYLPRLFDVPAGALYVHDASGTALRRVHEWGERGYPASVLPAQCHALREARAFAQPREPDARRCRHLPVAGGESAPVAAGLPPGAAPRPSDELCVPLVANGVTLGLLNLYQPGGQARSLLESPFVASAVEQIALAIWNLRLRETLRQQSIRDPLTRLYNRRYLEESLQRELFRAVRKRGTDSPAGLAVLMIDVDHFKRCNDLYGHEAGDTVLAEIGLLLRSLTRGSDIASRYGGEEFVLVLAEVTLGDACARAEQIRAAVQALELHFDGRRLPGTTISIGLAFYPEHGDSPAALLRAADAALYAAKREGRNQVQVASAEVHS